MKKILFGQKKGGCGKTTTATQTAAMFAGEGYKTLLVDTDENRNSIQFRENRPDTAVKFQAVSIPSVTIKDDLEEFDHDIIVIDSGGRDSKVFRSALFACDYFIMPVQASEYDIKLLEETLSIYQEVIQFKPTVKAGILSTMVIPNPRVKITGEGEKIIREIAEDYQADFFNSKIFFREGYIRTAEKGLSVVELNEIDKTKPFLQREKKYEKAAAEMIAFFEELKNLINI